MFERRRQIVLRKRSGTGQVVRIQAAIIRLKCCHNFKILVFLDVYKLQFLLISMCFAVFERRQQILLLKRSGTGQVVRIQAAQISL